MNWEAISQHEILSLYQVSPNPEQSARFGDGAALDGTLGTPGRSGESMAQSWPKHSMTTLSLPIALSPEGTLASMDKLTLLSLMGGGRVSRPF